MNHSLKDFYLWDLKQVLNCEEFNPYSIKKASCIKFEKDASNIILNLQIEDGEKMWEYYTKGKKL